MRWLVLLSPFMLTFVPVLFMWNQNVDEVDPALIPMLLGGALAGTVVLTALMSALFRDKVKAAAFSSLLVVYFFAAGHLWDLLWLNRWFSTRSKVTWSMVFAACLFLAWTSILARKDKALYGVMRFVLIFSTILTVYYTVNIVNDWPTTNWDADGAGSGAFIIPPPDFGPRPEPLTKETAATPDIYFIILDGYARQDVLAQHYEYDNAPFIDGLRKREFYVADKSTCNYPMTFLSLPATMNMRYIDEEIKAAANEQGSVQRRMYKMIHNNSAARFLQSKGYQYVSVNSIWGGSEVSPIADIELESTPLWLRSEFSSALIRSTAARQLIPSVAAHHHFVFNAVAEAAKIPGPTFTFSHMLVPHAPYVFDAEGNEQYDVPARLFLQMPTGGWLGKAGYLNQLIYTNKRILEMIDRILESSTVRPVIIIQADHGTASSFPRRDLLKDMTNPDTQTGILERQPILNALLVPDNVKEKLFPTFSPVNTFRLLFSEMFDADFPILKRKNYFGWYGQDRYKLTDVTDFINQNDGKPRPALNTTPDPKPDAKQASDQKPEQTPQQNPEPKQDQKTQTSQSGPNSNEANVDK